MHNTLVRNFAENKQKQDIKREAERLTLQRFVDEHEDCPNCSVCMGMTLLLLHLLAQQNSPHNTNINFTTNKPGRIV